MTYTILKLKDFYTNESIEVIVSWWSATQRGIYAKDENADYRLFDKDLYYLEAFEIIQ